MTLLKKALPALPVLGAVLISAELAFTYSSSTPPLGYTHAPGEASSYKVTHYEYMDQEPVAEAYYRIKQVDMDGKYEYSKVLFARAIGEESKYYRYNPLLQQIVIQQSIQLTQAVLFTLSGVPVDRSFNDNILNTAGLNKGIYILRLPSGQYYKVYLYSYN